MQIARTAVRLAQLLRMRPAQAAAVDIDLTTLAPPDDLSTEPAAATLTVDQLTAPVTDDAQQEWRATGPWRTQPGVRYRL